MNNRHEVDLTRSWARRAADGCRVVVGVTGVPDVELLRLTGRAGTVEAAVTPGAVTDTLEAVVSDAPDGMFRLALVNAAGTEVPLQARLMKRPQLPVALLPGPRPATRMPAPSYSRAPKTSARVKAGLKDPVRVLRRLARSVRR